MDKNVFVFLILTLCLGARCHAFQFTSNAFDFIKGEGETSYVLTVKDFEATDLTTHELPIAIDSSKEQIYYLKVEFKQPNETKYQTKFIKKAGANLSKNAIDSEIVFNNTIIKRMSKFYDFQFTIPESFDIFPTTFLLEISRNSDNISKEFLEIELVQQDITINEYSIRHNNFILNSDLNSIIVEGPDTYSLSFEVHNQSEEDLNFQFKFSQALLEEVATTSLAVPSGTIQNVDVLFPHGLNTSLPFALIVEEQASEKVREFGILLELPSPNPEKDIPKADPKKGEGQPNPPKKNKGAVASATIHEAWSPPSFWKWLPSQIDLSLLISLLVLHILAWALFLSFKNSRYHKILIKNLRQKFVDVNHEIHHENTTRDRFFEILNTTIHGFPDIDSPTKRLPDTHFATTTPDVHKNEDDQRFNKELRLLDQRLKGTDQQPVIDDESNLQVLRRIESCIKNISNQCRDYYSYIMDIVGNFDINEKSKSFLSIKQDMLPHLSEVNRIIHSIRQQNPESAHPINEFALKVTTLNEEKNLLLRKNANLHRDFQKINEELFNRFPDLGPHQNQDSTLALIYKLHGHFQTLRGELNKSQEAKERYLAIIKSLQQQLLLPETILNPELASVELLRKPMQEWKKHQRYLPDYLIYFQNTTEKLVEELEILKRETRINSDFQELLEMALHGPQHGGGPKRVLNIIGTAGQHQQLLQLFDLHHPTQLKDIQPLQFFEKVLLHDFLPSLNVIFQIIVYKDLAIDGVSILEDYRADNLDESRLNRIHHLVCALMNAAFDITIIAPKLFQRPFDPQTQKSAIQPTLTKLRTHGNKYREAIRSLQRAIPDVTYDLSVVGLFSETYPQLNRHPEVVH